MRQPFRRTSGNLAAAFVAAVSITTVALASPAGAIIGSPPSPPGTSGFYSVHQVASFGNEGSGLVTDGEGHLYVAASTSIFKMNLDGTHQSTLASGLSSGSKALCLAPNGKLWFGSSSSSNIWEINTDGTGQHVVANITGGPSGCAFDGFGHAYVSTLGNGIWKMNMDGTNPVEIASSTQAWGLTLDHAGHVLYANAFSGGYEMNLDGSQNAQVVTASKMEGVTALPDGTIMWSDYEAGEIFQSRADGSDAQLIASSLNSPEATVVMSNTGTIYFVSWSGGVVYRISYNPYAVAGVNSATASWAPSVSIGTPLTSYTVTGEPISGGVAVSATVPGTQTSATLYGLVNGTKYEFYVYASNAYGDSDNSSSSNIVAPGPQFPGTPTAPTATRLSGAARVNWSAPDAHGASILGYSVAAYRAGSLVATTRISVPGTATSAVLKGLTNGAPYQFSVLAINALGVSTESMMSAPVVPAGAPLWSSAPTATAQSRAARVSWSAAAANGSAITGYKVVSSPGARTCSTKGALTCTVTGLSPGVTYSFKVVATNHVGTSAPSAPSNKVVARA